MNDFVENCLLSEGVKIGRGSLVRYAEIGKNSAIWHYCNIYGKPDELVKIGVNSQVGSFSEIKPCVSIGDNCRLQSYVFIPEGVTLEDFIFVGPGVRFHNDKYPSAVKTVEGSWKLEHTSVHEHASIGGGALIGPGIVIGHHAIVGLGAVVVKNVQEYAIVCGNPAQVIGDVRDKRYLDKYPEAQV